MLVVSRAILLAAILLIDGDTELGAAVDNADFAQFQGLCFVMACSIFALDKYVLYQYTLLDVPARPDRFCGLELGVRLDGNVLRVGRR